ncbi:MAG: hypothetical protein IH624_17050 [Phycisphaerae bacterium]|nr:hypothetical protein [Phycisphaerae bacterium]
MRKVEQMSPIATGTGLAAVVCLTLALCTSMLSAQWALPEMVLDGDFDGSGQVDGADLALLSAHWRRRLAHGPWDGSPPRLVAHYRLDGDAVDSAGESDGLLHGTPRWVSGQNAAVGSGAVMLDGGDYISIAHHPAFDLSASLTLSAWVKTALPSDAATVISKGDAWKLAVGDDGRLNFSIGGPEGGAHVKGQRNVCDSTWRQVAAVYDRDNGQIVLYVDGQVDASETASGRLGVNESEVWIGGNTAEAGQWWNGSIDDVRLYNCVMTIQQIFNRMTWHVDAVNGRDMFNGQGKGRAFQTIQKAIDTADDGDEILVWPGVYTETVWFMGKAITVRSAADAAVIQAPGDYAVNFCFGEQEGSVLQNFVIANSEMGIFVESSRPILRHVTVVNNKYGLQAYTGSRPVVSNSIFWNNTHGDLFNDTYVPLVTFSCISRFADGEGNISVDPLFADATGGDYHLASETGRFVRDGEPGNSGAGGGYWVRDSQTSPCIDAADPTSNPMGEGMPNGARVNMGAYGGTAQASRSPWPLKCDGNYDGTVDAHDLSILAENWLCNSEECYK